MTEAGRTGPQPRTILGELGLIQSPDIVLPLADGSGGELRIGCVVRSDKAQALLLERLGLKLPERLLIPPRIAKMMIRVADFRAAIG